MTMMQWGVLLLAFVAGVLLVAGVVALARTDVARQRLQALTKAAATEAGAEGHRARRAWAALAAWTRPLQALAAPAVEQVGAAPPAAARAPRLPPVAADEVGVLRQRFMHAGIRHAQAVAAFFGVKALLALGLPVAAFVGMALAGALPRGMALPAALLLPAVLGYWGPNALLAHQVRVRQRAIFETFPDALDLMTVCVEAGLGTEAALLRVAEDLGPQSPALAEELRLVNLELRAGATRERALRNLALRTGVEEVEGFVTMIVQAERFGTRVAQALRVHADTLRTLRRQRAEEAAAKIALKLLFPLIFCIFPALLVVLLGPAVIQIRRVLLPAMGGGG
jgi:tight adherence protein C